LDEVQRHYPQAVRIVLSGEMNPEVILKTVRSTHQHLNKPCDPELLKQTVARAMSLRDILHDETLKQLVSRIDSLPSLPALYLQIMEELQSPGTSFKRVGDIIAKDVGMTAKILQMVNSAFFGLCRHISKPQEAVGYLGLETIKALVLSAHIFSQFNQKKVMGFDLDGLWNHSIATGVFARAIAGAENRLDQIGDEVFLAGILHDLGKLVLAYNLPEQYEKVIDPSLPPGGSAGWQIENEVFGTSHAEVGAYLMGLWGIKDSVVEAIALHHRVDEAGSAGGLLTTLSAANWIEHMENGSGETEEEWIQTAGLSERLPAWRKICLSKIRDGERHV
jgi:HD-like signal output (HDOD) protein